MKARKKGIRKKGIRPRIRICYIQPQITNNFITNNYGAFFKSNVKQSIESGITKSDQKSTVNINPKNEIPVIGSRMCDWFSERGFLGPITLNFYDDGQNKKTGTNKVETLPNTLAG